MLFRSTSGHLAAFTEHLQLLPVSQFGYEPFIFIGLRSSQFVIEMNHRENNANFLAQFEQQTKQSNRVRSSRNRDADPVSSFQELIFPDVSKYGLPQPVHRNILQPEAA